MEEVFRPFTEVLGFEPSGVHVLTIIRQYVTTVVTRTMLILNDVYVNVNSDIRSGRGDTPEDVPSRALTADQLQLQARVICAHTASAFV